MSDSPRLEPLSPANDPTPDEGGHELKLRTLLPDDYEDCREIMNKVFARSGGAWSRPQFDALLQTFPEGQICIEDRGQVIAVALAIIVDYELYGDRHTYYQITARATWTTHNSKGDTLYGVDVFVHPEHQNLRLGRRLYDARKEVCENLNLKRIIIGGRIPNYHKHSSEHTPQEYIKKVKNSELYDPVLYFQLANDFHVRRVLTGYLPEDRESHSYAVLMEWINIHYEPHRDALIGGVKPVVRVGVVQWQMRSVKSVDELMAQMEYFVDAVAGYNSDFIMFPELFNLPLMAQWNDMETAQAIRKLAEHTERLRDRLLELALSYNINIIAGSMPVYDGERLYNVAYLLRRNGTYDSQAKIHITPDEIQYWGVAPGDQLKIFETDVGPIGILICYDVEFPELPRLLSNQGMKILFVPFWTDTRNAYLRVRRCAQARAIENECYVGIAGSVGNLPNVENMDLQYSQAAIFTPSDFAFPHDAVAAEATPNTEMTLIADLDMDLLKELRSHGSVRNSRDRRPDLYRVQWMR